ncbi:SusC/RagA family TonB-linked outer membrane protein [Fulvivirgaceae bacterium BMA12]|uniref:SusC/RagA family TonB-linked outer membrane protein n=1 Tax=Agaribacillus aureus TaxID=3051825 RepID=A0ABT8LK31_9BACT|nr:SusC/RagA family TonB-linked outer membrane protein [Fulvivirgaceae bacterium BMA12]
MRNTYLYYLIILLSALCTNTAWAQQVVVNGKVLDKSSNETLAGVNVLIKGTTSGVITDIDGNFSLSVDDPESILIFSYIGYLSQEVSLAKVSSPFNVFLQEDVARLEEVVITGLASNIKRSNLANAVSTVSAKQLTGTTTPQTLDGALYGKLTGANIVANSGAPGGGISIRLRGVTTINGSSEPLYIIDGVYIDNSAVSPGTNNATLSRTNGQIADEQDNAANRIADLDPNDIESIEILKGASASAIYGARANAGVVIITTKRGKEGKTSINFSQDFGFTSILNSLGQRNFTEANVPADQLEAFRAARDNGRLIDYEDELYGETGILSNTKISATGGTEKTKFYVGASIADEEGIIKGTGFERRTLRANIDHKISDVVDFGVSTNFINSSADRSITNNDNSGVSVGISLANTPPWANLFPDADGNYPNNPFASSNFLQTRDLSTVNSTTSRFIGGGKVNVNLIRKDNTFLKLSLNGGFDSYTTETMVHFPEVLQWQRSGASANNGFLSRGDHNFLNINTSAILVFNTKASNWDLTSQLGTARLLFKQERATIQATQLIGGQSNLEQAGSLNAFNRELETEDVGYFFQQEANWGDKIILAAGIRMDKSSLNGDPNKLFGYPKLSAAGNLHNFGIINSNFITQLKVRAAYGESGGVPTPDPVDLQQPAFTIFEGANIDGNAGSLIGSTRGNSEIRPERSKEFETGIDLGLFDNKITIETSYYNRLVDDLILKAEVATSSGFQFRNINGGKLRNEGFELGISASPVNRGNIQWNSRVNFWFNRSKIERLDVPAFDAPNGGFASFLGVFRIQEGSSATQIVGPTPLSEGDVKIGDTEPDFQLSWFNNVTFLKRFEFSMLWHWKEGGDNINLTNLLADFAGTTHDFDDDDNGNGVVNGQERIDGFNSKDNAAAFIEDATYLKLREVSLYYTIPPSVLQGIFNGSLEKVRVGVSGNNLLLFSGYNSYDPEVSNFGSNSISTGVEVAPFPSSRRMFFHLNVSF